MTTIRLDRDMETKLELFSSIENRPKSAVIKAALNEYFSNHTEVLQPYALGEDLFGIYGSGDGTLSINYKQVLKDGLREKHSH